MNKQQLPLLIMGIFVLSIAQIVTHFVQLPDFANGLFMGIGLGLLAISLIKSHLQINS